MRREQGQHLRDKINVFRLAKPGRRALPSLVLLQFLICSLAFATFAVDRKLPQNRLQLSFTLVLTSVAFKFVVNQSLPKISYLTYLVGLFPSQNPNKGRLAAQ